MCLIKEGDKEDKLVYKVEQLPESLLNNIFTLVHYKMKIKKIYKNYYTKIILLGRRIIKYINN